MWPSDGHQVDPIRRVADKHPSPWNPWVTWLKSVILTATLLAKRALALTHI